MGSAEQLSKFIHMYSRLINISFLHNKGGGGWLANGIKQLKIINDSSFSNLIESVHGVGCVPESIKATKNSWIMKISGRRGSVGRIELPYHKI